jgi:hypothetical protein
MNPLDIAGPLAENGAMHGRAEGAGPIRGKNWWLGGSHHRC